MMREQTMSSNDPTSNTEMSPKTKREREGEIIELKSGTEVHVYADDEQKGIEGLHVHV